MKDQINISGVITWTLCEEDSGLVIASGIVENLVTQIGSRMYAERALGITGAPAAPTGMKLGSGSTAVATSGVGAAIATYLAGSDQAFVATFPQSILSGNQRQIKYRSTWAAGVATTNNPITEAAIVNDALTDANSAAGNTIARGLLTGIPSKTAGQSLTLDWIHNIGPST